MPKPIILHLGSDIKYNHDYIEKELQLRFEVTKNEDLDRASFMQALRDKNYGDFSAIFRPDFHSGGEMGQWDDELISLLPRSVRIFASAGAGFNWADVDALGRRGIWYANGAGASDEAVSDTALFMILSVFRNFARAQLAARTVDPKVFEETHAVLATISHNPRGHVLGIVGLGSISKKLAIKARLGLVMEVHYFDIVRADVQEEERLGVIYHGTLESLLSVSDCVTLHTPLNKNTENLIDEKAFQQMKPGALKLMCGNVGRVVRLASKFRVFGGASDYLVPTLEAGGCGCVTGLANVFPRSTATIYDLWKKGDVDEAKRLQQVVANAEWSCKKTLAATKFGAWWFIGRKIGLDERLAFAPRKPYLETDSKLQAWTIDTMKVLEDWEDKLLLKEIS